MKVSVVAKSRLNHAACRWLSGGETVAVVNQANRAQIGCMNVSVSKTDVSAFRFLSYDPLILVTKGSGTTRFRTDESSEEATCGDWYYTIACTRIGHFFFFS